MKTIGKEVKSMKKILLAAVILLAFSISAFAETPPQKKGPMPGQMQKMPPGQKPGQMPGMMGQMMQNCPMMANQMMGHGMMMQEMMHSMKDMMKMQERMVTGMTEEDKRR